jgi:hypothetical protein
MSTTYTALFDHIREKCRRQRWYGPEMRDPAWFGNRYDPALDHDGRLRAKLNDPQKDGFKYPPATEEQLLATEEALGFPLPPVLRALYAEIANGGFGFGYGLRGAIGGFDESGPGSSIADSTFTSSSEGETLPWCDRPLHLIDLADYEDRWEGVTGSGKDGVVRTFRYLVLPCHLWPERFLPICNWGCGIESCLDGIRGGVYRVGVTKEEAHLISLQAPSLENMFERWVQLPYDSLSLLRGY